MHTPDKWKIIKGTKADGSSSTYLLAGWNDNTIRHSTAIELITHHSDHVHIMTKSGAEYKIRLEDEGWLPRLQGRFEFLKACNEVNPEGHRKYVALDFNNSF